MPQAAIAAVATYAGVSQATAALIITVAVTAATTAYNYQQQKAAEQRAKDSYNDSLTDHQVMVRTAIAPRNIVYGRDKVSGPIVFAKSTGDKGQFLHLVVALAGHEVDAIETVYFNEIALPTEGADGFVRNGQFSVAEESTFVETFTTAEYDLAHPCGAIQSVVATTTVTSTAIGDGGGEATFEVYTQLSPGQYTLTGQHLSINFPAASYTINYSQYAGKPRVRVRKHLGGPGQVADPDLVAECGPQWTSQHVGAGTAYLYVRLEYDTDVFGQIGIPNISAVVRGKKLRDPRTGATAWSDNAALCVADYLRDASLGLGSLAAEVVDSEVIAAANVCDELVALDHFGATQKRYTTNGTVSTADGRRANLQKLLEPMAGAAVWAQGRWLVRAGAHRSPEFVLDETWIADGPRQILPRVPRSSLFNAVSGTYIDPAQGHAEVQFPPVTNSVYEAQDGGRRITVDGPMPLVNEARRAQRLGKIRLERARQAVTLKLTCNMRAYDTIPTQVGVVNLARYGYAGKLFEVRERTFDPAASKVFLTLAETAPAVWDWAYGEATLLDPAPDTDLPSPFALPLPLSGLAVATGTAQLLRMADGTIVTRGRVSWNPSLDVFVQQGGSVEVQWKVDDAATWQSAPAVPGDSTSTMIGPLDDRRFTLVRVRGVNALGRAGPWNTVAVLVVGKTQPPADVLALTATTIPTGSRISWADNLEADYDHTELRIGSSWATGALLFSGAANAYGWVAPPVGSWTVWAKHVDTSGNESATAASIVITVTSAQAVTWASLAGRPQDLFNLVLTPTFENFAPGDRGGSWPLPAYVNPVSGVAWSKSLVVSQRDTIEENPFPLREGERLFVAADLASRNAYPINFGVACYNAAGAYTGFVVGCTVPAGGGFSRVTGSIVAPPGTVTGRSWLQIPSPPGTAPPFALATNLYLGRAEPGATVGADWSTNVSNIAVTTEQMVANAVSTRVEFVDNVGYISDPGG